MFLTKNAAHSPELKPKWVQQTVRPRCERISNRVRSDVGIIFWWKYDHVCGPGPTFPSPRTANQDM